MSGLKLFIALLGGRQKDDKLEAHNLFVGVGETLEALLPQIKKGWKGVTHVDAFMILEQLDGYEVKVRELKAGETADENKFPRLMVYNIGYYKPKQFTEFHKLIPVVLRNEKDSWKDRLNADPDFATGQALNETVRSHVDDKYKLDIIAFDADDVIDVQKEIAGYIIELSPLAAGIQQKENVLELGYLFLKELKEIERQ